MIPQDLLQDAGSPIGAYTQDPNEKVYVGTKVIRATPMHHNDFLISQGKSVEPNAETLGDGYKVKYDDGYESWSPKAVFERCYREVSTKEKMMIY